MLQYIFQSFVYKRDKLKEWQKNYAICCYGNMFFCQWIIAIICPNNKTDSCNNKYLNNNVFDLSNKYMAFSNFSHVIFGYGVGDRLCSLCRKFPYIVASGRCKSKYEMQGVLLIVIDKMVLFLIILFIKRFFYRKTEMLRDSEWLKFIVFPIFTIMVIAGMIAAFSDIDSPKQIGVAYMIAFGMIGMNLIVYVILNSVIDNAIEQHEKEVLEIQVKIN